MDQEQQEGVTVDDVKRSLGVAEDLPNDAPDDITPYVTAARWLTGELVKVCELNVKTLDQPWSQMTDQEKRDTQYRFADVCRKASREAVRIIESQGRAHVEAEIESVTFKDGIKVVLKMGKGQVDRLDVADAVGGVCLLVLPDYGALEGDVPKAKEPPEPSAADKTIPLPLEGAASTEATTEQAAA